MIKNVLFSNQCRKAIRKLSTIERALISLAIKDVIEGRRIGELGTGDLKDIHIVRLRLGRSEYRMAYRHEGTTCVALLVGPRERFYERLKRILK